jgi:hypothetical protein
MRFNRWQLWALALSALTAACGLAPGQDGGSGRTRLAVLVSVDQFPAYLFERYDSLYSGGLRRLLDEGRSYTNAVHDHAMTWTSAGHATLATGMVPARHGIVGNNWYEQAGEGWRRVESVDDTTESIIGVPGKVGMSPRNLAVTGLADWFLAADPQAQAVTISGKRTASVLMAGQTRSAHVLYFEDDVGRFVTSTYYRDSTAEWAQRFNSDVLPGLLADSTWECTVADELRELARPDATPYEHGGQHTSFPHRAADELSTAGSPAAYYDWWDHTPALDRAIVALAIDAVTALELGSDDHVDYLGVSLSQLDRVGHEYGPLSLEQLDAILRVDRLLGEFFEFLDEHVGRGRYVVAFTSDHGVVQLPGYRQAQGLTGGSVGSGQIRDAYAAANEGVTASSDGEDHRDRVAQALEQLDFIADVMTVEELAGPASPDSFVALYQRSYYPGRVRGALARQGLVVRLVEGLHVGPEPTTHGSPYLYDRLVPLIFVGPSISSGSVDEPVRSVDLAPTLTRAAGISYPADLDGRPLF